MSYKTTFSVLDVYSDIKLSPHIRIAPSGLSSEQFPFVDIAQLPAVSVSVGSAEKLHN